MGLLNAVRRFDSTCGASFETYARLRIRGAVFDELRRLDWVPRSVHDKAKRVEKVMQEVGQRTGRVPSGLEMARALKLSPPEYEELLEEIRPSTYLCLDTLRKGDFEQGAPAHDLVSDSSQASPEASAERREINDLIGRRMGQLPENQRKVLALYYFEDLRLREIATAFGVTESRICQIHAQAILSLKALLRRYDPELFNEPALLDTYS
jgi:RNA polymerase sigma factor for flagellar operon FliA